MREADRQGLSRWGAALVVAGLALWLSACRFGRTPEPSPVIFATPTVSVGTSYTVQRGPVARTLQFEAKAILAVEEDLFFNSSGRVHIVHVESGDTVAVDQVIAELDTRDLEFAVEDALLTLELAQQRLVEAAEKLAYEQQSAQIDLMIENYRLQTLQGQGLATIGEQMVQELRVEQARLVVDRLEVGVDAQLKVAVERAELALTQAQAELADARITAPFAGQVRLFEELEEGRGVQAYEPVATVIDPAAIELEANLLDTELEQLHEGMVVEIVPSNRENSTLAGTIVQLPQPYGSGTDASTHILVNDPLAAGLRAGMTVTISAELERVSEALWLPPSAVHGFPDNYFVMVREGDQVREVDVTVGVQTEERVQIIDGVKEGQTVVGG